MKKLFLVFLILFAFAACRDKPIEPQPQQPQPQQPQPPKQYSTWIVNGTDTFRTNNVDTQISWNPDHSYGGAVIMSHDNANWFSLGFNTDFFPIDGIYILYTPNSIGIKATLKLYYNNKYYHGIPYDIDTLIASSQNEKASYSLSNCRFINHDNNNDTISIQGVFNMP